MSTTENNNDSQNSQQGRQNAVRVFASEFNDIHHTFKESDDERAPNFALLPTGEKANRVYFVGTLTETEEQEYEEGNVMTARVIDNSGNPESGRSSPFFIRAGSRYQTDEFNFLKEASPPAYVAVVGKVNVYEPEDGDNVYTSIRPESITEVDQTTRRNWIIEAANHTLTRVENFNEARENGTMTPLQEDAIAEYGSDLSRYVQGVETVLTQLQEDTE